MNNYFSVGSSIEVKTNTFCPNYPSLNISNWKGTICNMYNINNCFIALIRWNSNTIKNMPKDFISYSISNDLDYKKMFLDCRKLICL